MPRLFRQGIWNYVFKEDRKLDRKDQPRFQFTTLTPEENAEMEDGLFESRHDVERGKKQEVVEIQQTANSSAIAVETLRRGMKGWENWFINGKEVAFKNPGGSRCAMENIAKLTPEARLEAADAITEGNSLSEEDSKKSESAVGSGQAKKSDPAASAPNSQN